MPPTFTRDIRPVLLCLSSPSRLLMPTGLSPSMAAHSRALRLHNLEGIRAKAAKPHISPVLPQGIRFALCPVRSPLLRASRLLSFPAGTQMFHFPAFPLLTERLGFTQAGVPFGHPGFHGYLRLARAYRSLSRPSSAPEPSHPPGGVRQQSLLRR